MPKSGILFLFLLIFVLPSAKAQISISSPYSRYAFGELTSSGFAGYSGMGYANIAMSDSTLINIGNPASFAFFIPHRPLFDFGASGIFTKASTSEASSNFSAMGLRNIALGIPINERFGFSLGVVPFSSVGYELSTTTNEAGIGDVTYNFNGSGGLNKIYLGFAGRAINTKKHQLAFGITGNYLFGNITRSRTAYYPSYTGIKHTKVVNHTIVSDFLFESGVYDRIALPVNEKVKRDSSIVPVRRFLSFGATYTLGNEISARQDMLAYTFKNAYEILLDTVAYTDTTSGYLSFPEKIGFGVAYEWHIGRTGNDFTRVQLSVQGELQNWSRYAEVFGNSVVEDQLKNARNFALGMSITPLATNKIEKGKFHRIMTYRMGLRYADTYLNLYDTQIKQYGISFGLGIPLVQTFSFSQLNVGFEFGKRGTTENNLLQENYLAFQVGFTIMPHKYDGWFYKRKYD
jgi:hypothetical protein